MFYATISGTLPCLSRVNVLRGRPALPSITSGLGKLPCCERFIMKKELQSLKRRHAAVKRQMKAAIQQRLLLQQQLHLLHSLCESFVHIGQALQSRGHRASERIEVLQLQCELQQQLASTSNLDMPFKPAEVRTACAPKQSGLMQQPIWLPCG
jgi:hypothetical protein